MVEDLAAGPVAAIALAAAPAGGPVRALCFAGFGALSPLGGDFRLVLAAVRGAEATAEALRRDAAGVCCGLESVLAAAEAQRGRAAELEAWIGAVESAVLVAAAAGVSCTKPGRWPRLG